MNADKLLSNKLGRFYLRQFPFPKVTLEVGFPFCRSTQFVRNSESSIGSTSSMGLLAPWGLFIALIDSNAAEHGIELAQSIKDR
jgi:hypothetical protein